jgi:hypothetical protein
MAKQIGASQTVTASAAGAEITLPALPSGVRRFAISAINTGGASDAYVFDSDLDSAGTTSEVVPASGARYDSPWLDSQSVTSLKLYASVDTACRVTVFVRDFGGE